MSAPEAPTASAKEGSLRLRISNGKVSTENVRRVAGKTTTLGSHPGQAILQFVAWTANPDGTDIASADTGCLCQVTGHSGFDFPSVEVEMPRVSAARAWAGMTIRLLHEPEETGSGFQVIAESVLPMGHRVSSAFVKRNNITVYKDNDCFYGGKDNPNHSNATEETSPLQRLTAGPCRCDISGAELVADDPEHNLFAWENPDVQVAHVSAEVVGIDGGGQVVPSTATQARVQQQMVQDEEVMQRMWCRGGDWYKRMFRRGQASTFSGGHPLVQYPSIYQQLVPCARKTLQCHHAAHQLDPRNCRVAADVLLSLARLGCKLSDQSFPDYLAQCDAKPTVAVAGAHATALKVAASATRYKVDRNSRGKAGERFTNMTGMFCALACAGLDSSRASADCEDYGYFICKLHTAYANPQPREVIMEQLERAGVKDLGERRAGADALQTIAKAAKCYSGFPVTCSTYNASAHGDVVAGCAGKKHITHTVAVLFPGPVIDAMKRPANAALPPGFVPMPGVLVEGTAIVSCEGGVQDTNRQAGAPLPVDVAAQRFAATNGADSIFPMPLQGSRFYAYANQLPHAGNGYACLTRPNQAPGKLGVPFMDFLRNPARHCRLEQMYPEPSEEEKETNRRFLVGRCPPFQLDSPTAATWERNRASACNSSQSDTSLHSETGAPMGPWGVLRGVAPLPQNTQDRLQHHDGLSVVTHPIARGLNLVLYTKPTRQ